MAAADTEERVIAVSRDGEPIEVDQYSIDISIPDNEMRILFHTEFGAVSSFVINAPGGYEFAQRILRAYDKLEGI